MTVVEALPAGARLFHIGPQKTGTTALQAAATARRAELLAAGVLYPEVALRHRPDVALNHRLPVAALVGKRIGWKETGDGSRPAPPPRSYWTRLVEEVRAHPEMRAWFGHEYAAGADVPVIRELAETFGSDLHVLITLRSFSLMLPSIWQETNKSAGNRGTFDRWLARAFDDRSYAGQVVRTRHDQGALVRRWADVVGTDNVTVVVLDPRDHDFLYHAVEDLLGLPRNLLADAGGVAHAANRSMTVPEIELFRQFNKRFRAGPTTWLQYNTLAVHGAIRRVLAHRRPPDGEARLTLPDWAADLADEWSIRNAAEVAASGVRVIGDPTLLAAPARRRRLAEEDHRTVTSVPVDLAAEAMLGVAAAAIGLDPGLEPPQKSGSLNPLSLFTAGELVQELYRRGRNEARERLKLRPR